jgi:hypothetical protein
MSVLRKPYLSKMFIYNSLNFNMFFMSAHKERDYSEET